MRGIGRHWLWRTDNPIGTDLKESGGVLQPAADVFFIFYMSGFGPQWQKASWARGISKNHRFERPRGYLYNKTGLSRWGGQAGCAEMNRLGMDGRSCRILQKAPNTGKRSPGFSKGACPFRVPFRRRAALPDGTVRGPPNLKYKINKNIWTD